MDERPDGAVPAYPLFLDLRGRPCLVVGGGSVAEPRVQALLAAGAHVTLVSPTVTPALAALVGEGRLRHEPRAWQAADLAGAALALVATGDPTVTEAVAREARQRGIWVNAADDTDCCDFFLPAVIRRGALTVAVGTGGTSPALARAVRDHLAALLTDDYALLAELAAEVRLEVRARGIPVGGRRWQRALREALDDLPGLRRLVAEEGREAARRHLLARLTAAGHDGDEADRPAPR